MSSSYMWEPTRKAKGDAVSAPALDVTMIVVSSFLVIFAVIAQLLTTTGSSRLDTTQMVTIWLVVAGLIVLLSITYMICRAHMTVSRDVSGEAPVTEQQLPHGIKIVQQGVPARREAQWIGILTTESGLLAHIKYDDGSEAKVPLNQVYSLN